MTKVRSMKKIAFEFLSIVVAVLLAMGLSEWRQDVLNKRQAEKSFNSILDEVSSNCELLRPDSVAMMAQIEQIDQWLAADKVGRDTLSSFEYELNLLSKSAWEVAKLNTSLTHIENDRLQYISLIYELHDFYSESERKILASVIDIIELDTEDPRHEKAIKGLQFQMLLTYDALTEYLEAARPVLSARAAHLAKTSSD